jgi:predicted transposase YbfD/YdcC
MMYRNESLNALAWHLGMIEDPRDDRGKLHRLIDILILAVYGMLWGHTDFTNMAKELKYHEDYFVDLLGLLNGIPSHDTFSAVFSVINPQEFLECFLSWTAGITSAKGKHVAIDGKAVRAACDKVHGGQVPYLVNTYVAELGLCIGQIRIDEKTNEIKGIPEMLEWLDLEGATISIDAIGCQKEIVRMLAGKGADFVLQVKDNQPTLRDDIMLEMQARIQEKEIHDELDKRRRGKGIHVEASANGPLDVYQQCDHDHGRIERRTCYVLNDSACVNSEEWPEVKSVGLVFRERLIIKRDADGNVLDGEPSGEWSVYVMSRAMAAEELACHARTHWSIENGLHWVLDDFFREDRCTARVGHATENLGLLRKAVFNMMKLDENVKKESMKGKQVYYRNNPDAIWKLIFEDIPRIERNV